METKTLFHKIWERHLMESECDGQWALVRADLLEAENSSDLNQMALPNPGNLSLCRDALGWHGAFGSLSLKVTDDLAARIKDEGMVVLRKPNVMAVHIMGSLKHEDSKKAIDEINRLAFKDLEDSQVAHTVIEYVGPGVAEMDMEMRMELCQHAMDQGAASAIMAPDEKTFDMIKPENHDQRDRTWDLCMKSWRGLFADMFACYDQEAYLNACRI